MYITLDLEPSDYDTDLMFVRVIRNWKFNNREYMAETTMFTAPKYQAIAMQNALKAANPEDYHKQNVLSIVNTNNAIIGDNIYSPYGKIKG